MTSRWNFNFNLKKLQQANNAIDLSSSAHNDVICDVIKQNQSEVGNIDFEI